jgi:hypothetical protein
MPVTRARRSCCPCRIDMSKLHAVIPKCLSAVARQRKIGMLRRTCPETRTVESEPPANNSLLKQSGQMIRVYHGRDGTARLAAECLSVA